ncbi:hypothetical protein [Streptomyces avermitilis]|uniref:hypothetical protein n=1 Tax=Streptomyces avermitilis TaxID=33903 RepID=UPI0036BD6C7B
MSDARGPATARSPGPPTERSADASGVVSRSADPGGPVSCSADSGGVVTVLRIPAAR